MQKLFVILFLLLAIASFSQSSSSSTTKKIYTRVDKMPQYPGGQQALLQVFLDSIDFPRVRYNDLDDSDLSAKVVLKFIIDENGKVLDAVIVKSGNTKLNDKLIAVAKRLKFKPGLQDGKPVKVEYIFPFTFDFELR